MKLTSKQRQRIRLVQLRKITRSQKGLARNVAAQLNKQARAAARSYEENGMVTAASIEAFSEPLKKIFNKYYRAIASTASTDTIVGLKAATPVDVLMQEWIAERVKTVVGSMNKTTWRLVNAAIANGAAEDLSTREIARSITRSAGGNMARRRALTIARTEIHSAANTASFQAARATGVTMLKVWTASQDDRTREEHAAADGTVVGIDESFSAAGINAQHPGDVSAPPSDLVNCRCVVVFTPA